jgi:hypothetical protein
VQYSIVTSDFTRASFIFFTLCARDYAVEAELFPPKKELRSVLQWHEKTPRMRHRAKLMACHSVSYEKKELSSPGQNIQRASP